MRVSKTYDIVTPESAEVGDFEESGFKYEDFELETHSRLKFALREIETLSCPHLNNWDHRCASVYEEGEGSVDYRTGGVTQEALHFKFANKYEARAFRRMWLLKFGRKHDPAWL